MIIWIHTLDQGLYLSYRALGLCIQVETVAHLQLHNQINVNSRTRTDQCNDGFCWSARRDKLNTVATRASVCFILMSKHRPFLLLQIAKSIGVGTLLLIIHNKAVCDNLVSHADSWTSDVGEPLNRTRVECEWIFHKWEWHERHVRIDTGQRHRVFVFRVDLHTIVSAAKDMRSSHGRRSTLSKKDMDLKHTIWARAANDMHRHHKKTVSLCNAKDCCKS